MEVGDWVRGYHPGIWRVHRIVAGFYEPRYSLAATKTVSNRTLVFAQRFVNDQWKRAFSTQCWEVSLTAPLEPHERVKLESFIHANPEMFGAFEKSKPKSVDLLLNLAFGVPATLSKDEFSRHCFELFSDHVAQGITSDQILGIVAQNPVGAYLGRSPTNATLQFACKNHEVVEQEFVYRTVQALPF